MAHSDNLPPSAHRFDNVLNVRDFGGLVSGAGASVAQGKLFRGGHLASMKSADRKRFANLGVNLVVDFRHKPERERQPTIWEDGYQPITVIYDDAKGPHDSSKLAPHEIFMIEKLDSAQQGVNFMLGSYKARPHDGGFVAAARKTLVIMAETGDGLYVHCAAGKDRTGTFCAIVLLALGADLDDIYAEYMLTQQSVNIDPILSMAAKHMGKKYGRPFDPEHLRPIFGVAPEFLAQSLETMGDFDSYWRDGLGLDASHIDALRGHYLH